MAWWNKDKGLADILAPLTKVKSDIEAWIAKAHEDADGKVFQAKKLNDEAAALLEEVAGAEKVSANLSALLGTDSAAITE